MGSEILQSMRGDPVMQLSVFADNKVGRLNDLVGLLGSHDIHVIALSTQDTTDSTIIRLVLDYPDRAKSLFSEHGYFFTERELVAVEIDAESQLKHVTAALVQAEINIYYVYPFIVRPNGRAALAISLEDNDLAAEVLSNFGLKVLLQSDITR